MEITKSDLQKSQQMFKEKEKFDKVRKEFEKKQRTFIEEIVEKYNIKTKDEFDKVFNLFPESANRYLFWNNFQNK